MAEREAIGDIAAKALQEPKFAQEVLGGGENAEVRQAIMEELADAVVNDPSLFEAFLKSSASSGDRLGELARTVGREAPKPW